MVVIFLQMAEYRISICGRKQSEWDQLASWFIDNEIYSENAVWLIQVCSCDFFFLKILGIQLWCWCNCVGFFFPPHVPAFYLRLVVKFKAVHHLLLDVTVSIKVHDSQSHLANARSAGIVWRDLVSANCKTSKYSSNTGSAAECDKN